MKLGIKSLGIYSRNLYVTKLLAIEKLQQQFDVLGKKIFAVWWVVFSGNHIYTC